MKSLWRAPVIALNNYRHNRRNAPLGNIPGFHANRSCGRARRSFNRGSKFARDQGKNTSILAILADAGINARASCFFSAAFRAARRVQANIRATRSVYCALKMRRGNKLPARALNNKSAREPRSGGAVLRRERIAAIRFISHRDDSTHLSGCA